MPTYLGQNFLINENIARKIVNSADIKDKNILEIGPGRGILTKYLAKKAKKVLVVELDKNLIKKLKKTFAPHLMHKSTDFDSCNISQRSASCVAYPTKNKDRNLFFIEGNILKINLPKLVGENDFQNYTVVANLPYYITSKIIRLLLETKYPPSEMILMVQKEVGERICALDEKESILSISVKFYADPKILFHVSRENFDPVPEVDSTVIRIKRKNNPSDTDPKKFFSLVRAGFSAKRKTLANNLSNGLHLPKEKVFEIIKKSGLDPKVRAEKLKLEDWIKLYKNKEK